MISKPRQQEQFACKNERNQMLHLGAEKAWQNPKWPTGQYHAQGFDELPEPEAFSVLLTACLAWAGW